MEFMGKSLLHVTGTTFQQTSIINDRCTMNKQKITYRGNSVCVNQKERRTISSCRSDLCVSRSPLWIKCYRKGRQQRNVHQFRRSSPCPAFLLSIPIVPFSWMEILPRKSPTKTSKRITSRTNEGWTSGGWQKVEEEFEGSFRGSLTNENSDDLLEVHLCFKILAQWMEKW